jgi:hypothetical protein
VDDIESGNNMIAVTDISSILASSQDSSAGATAICIGCEYYHILRIYRRIVEGKLV